MDYRKITMLSAILSLVSGFHMGMSTSPENRGMRRKVIVTGAGGRTGKLVFSNLMADPRYEAVGVVRDKASAKKLIKNVNCASSNVVACDVTTLSENNIPEGFTKSQALIICTSAVPQLNKLSLFQAFLKIPYNIIRRRKAINPRDFRFKFKAGQYPEMIDYEGQKTQIDIARKLGVQQVVVVSSMGGTDSNNFLNSIGKNKDGTGEGDILVWKRKAEKYLVDSGLQFTIIHPGGLTDNEEGVSKLIFGVDDHLLEDSKRRSISRGDVASLCVAALSFAPGQSISFDCISEAVDDKVGIKAADEALKEFFAQGITTNYS